MAGFGAEPLEFLTNCRHKGLFVFWREPLPAHVTISAVLTFGNGMPAAALCGDSRRHLARLVVELIGSLDPLAMMKSCRGAGSTGYRSALFYYTPRRPSPNGLQLFGLRHDL
jgi:hypothetical protein